MTQCEWHPYIDNQIIQCGMNQITFWTYDGNSLNKKAGIFEVSSFKTYLLCRNRLHFMYGTQLCKAICQYASFQMDNF